MSHIDLWKSTIILPIYLGTTSKQKVQMEKYLQVSFASNLSFENHIATKISKAKQMVGLYVKAFSFSTLTALYCISSIPSRIHVTYLVTTAEKAYQQHRPSLIPCNQIDQMVSKILSTRRDYCGRIYQHQLFFA